MTTPGEGCRLARAALRDQRGTAFLMGLMIVMVMTLLGVALFEMSTIEAGLARSDALDIQAFYCAEAEAARVYALYAPDNDQNAERSSNTLAATSLTLANGIYVSRASAEVNGDGVTVTATCTLPNGAPGRCSAMECASIPTRSSSSPRPGRARDPQSVFGDMVLGSADVIRGDIYVSGNVHLQGGVNGRSGPSITVTPGKLVTTHVRRRRGKEGQVTPLPVLSNAQGSGIIDQIRSKVTNPDGTPKMTGRYQDATVYNLGEIFAQLGATNEGNRERNLARPTGCTFGSASKDVKCQIWQDLAILGPRQTCGPRPAGPRADGQAELLLHGVAAEPVARAAGHALPRHLCRGRHVQPGAAAARVHDALRLARLEARRDPRRRSHRRGPIDRLVDLTVGMDPATGKGMERPPSIFYVDGYWRTDGSASGFAYNGRGTIVASKSVILSDSLLYLGKMSNVNADAPKAGCANPNDRGLCGAADMLGIIAQENIWIGDPRGPIHEVDAVMLAGHDINLVQYAASAATCCDGVNNQLTFNGTVLGLRGTALARDWADPTPGHQDVACNAAQPPCRPVTFVQADTSCGRRGARGVAGGSSARIPRPDSSPSIRL